MTELLNTTDFLRNEFRKSFTFIPHGRQVRVGHNGHEPLPITEALAEYGGLVEELYPDGKLPRKLPNPECNITDMDHEQFFNWMRRRVGRYSKLVNPSLDSATPTGFNSHARPHVENVIFGALDLLPYKKDNILKAIVGGGMAHDIGNSHNRQHHPIISLRMLSLLAPELHLDKHLWQLIKEGVLLHEEAFASAYFMDHYAAKPSQQIAVMQKYFAPSTLALIIADKADIGPHRVTQKQNIDGKAVINGDYHLWVNLAGETVGIGLSRDGLTFSWDLDFFRSPSREEDDRFAKDADGIRVLRAPAEVHEMKREHGIPHINTWQARLISLYFPRLAYMIKAVFALYPDIDEFSMHFRDTFGDPDRRSRGGIYEVISREEVDLQLTDWANKYLTPEDRIKMQKRGYII